MAAGNNYQYHGVEFQQLLEALTAYTLMHGSLADLTNLAEVRAEHQKAGTLHTEFNAEQYLFNKFSRLYHEKYGRLPNPRDTSDKFNFELFKMGWEACKAATIRER